MTATQQQAPLPGSQFDLPGVQGGATQWTDQDETVTNLSTPMSQTSIAPVTLPANFKQTDIVVDWYYCLNITQTYTTGTSALTASAYAPFNVIGGTRLLIQNQYASVDVESGIDLYIFNLIRPFSFNEVVSGLNNYANPAGSPVGGTATGYLTTAVAQGNNIDPAIWTTGLGSYNLMLRLPAGQWFDRYYDLDLQGPALTPGFPALVTPQYMAGTTRQIAPLINLNPGSAATTDLAPVNIGAGTGTFTGTGLSRFRRKAIYAGNPSASPSVYAWQYRWRTQRANVAGQSRVDINIPNDTGQLLAVYVRLFDPAAAAGLGAPVNINTITRANLQYGSGLFWFDAQIFGNGPNAAALLQRQWFQKHNVLLPPGVIAFDLAIDERGQMTNARALNTLTTAGIVFHIEFTGALSNTAYAVLGTESLVYVA